MKRESSVHIFRQIGNLTWFMHPVETVHQHLLRTEIGNVLTCKATLSEFMLLCLGTSLYHLHLIFDKEVAELLLRQTDLRMLCCKTI
jgi:hypothetical protein